MKLVGLAIVRTNNTTTTSLNNNAEPVLLAVANDLASFGYFQRQVS